MNSKLSSVPACEHPATNNSRFSATSEVFPKAITAPLIWVWPPIWFSRLTPVYACGTVSPCRGVISWNGYGNVAQRCFSFSWLGFPRRFRCLRSQAHHRLRSAFANQLASAQLNWDAGYSSISQWADSSKHKSSGIWTSIRRVQRRRKPRAREGPSSSRWEKYGS